MRKLYLNIAIIEAGHTYPSLNYTKVFPVGVPENIILLALKDFTKDKGASYQAKLNWYIPQSRSSELTHTREFVGNCDNSQPLFIKEYTT